MKEKLKKIARTLTAFFPFLKDFAYPFKRTLRIILNSPVERDFYAIDLFPDYSDILFLDIGANQGAVTDVLLRRSKNCNIYAFEPNPPVFKKLQSRFKSQPRVKLYNFGLGEKEGTFKLYVPVYRGREFDGWGSLSPDFDDTWLSKQIYFYNRKYLYLREMSCEIKRLDDLHLEPFFTKVDVEGSELKVFRGSAETIKKSCPIILMESGERDEAVREFLGQFGYKLYRYYRGSFIEGKYGSPNSFFMTNEKYHLILSHA